MISVKLSMEQLIEIFQSLSPNEKELIRTILNDEASGDLSEEQMRLISSRQQAYNSGDMAAHSLDELKYLLKYTED